MKRLYARLVLWLIRPALEEWRLEWEAKASALNALRETEAYRSAFSREAQAFRSKLRDLPCSD